MAGIPSFRFEHAGSHKPLAWPKYKLKECWTLVLCLMALQGQSGPVIVHNWWDDPKVKFSREFRDRRAASVDPQLADAPMIEPHAAGNARRLAALVLAAGLAILPISTLVTLARWAMPEEISPMVTFCDGHLAGFVLTLAARAKGAHTYTLHHGLYRSDDIGSIMCSRNFVSDRILLWDSRTQGTFEAAGVATERLTQVGEYGFGALSGDGDSNPTLIVLCPPYDVEKVSVFRHLASVLPDTTTTLWSLHPMLRANHPDLPRATISDVTPRPALAICGDSGALMDALARNIPVISIADRPLTTASLSVSEASAVDKLRMAEQTALAQTALAEDRRTFGFDTTATTATKQNNPEVG